MNSVNTDNDSLCPVTQLAKLLQLCNYFMWPIMTCNSVSDS